jgi:hypothetical protein
MTSVERRLARYQRRQAARKNKRDKTLAQYDYSILTDADNLCEAFHKSKRGVSWKESVQRFEASLFRNIAELRRKLINGESVQKGFAEFTLRERGKIRHIKSVHISERVVQKVLSDKILVPLLSPPLIHDNGASVKNKGVHFALRRLICHLTRFYKSNNCSSNGYALLVDFSKYFDNINHEILLNLIDKRITDSRVRTLVRRFVSVFGDGKSLGLGSQISQVSAIFYPTGLDHFIKEKLRIKYYGRYMDDLYLIHSEKKHLQYCLHEIKAFCETLKITINERKTRIAKLSGGIQFLKGKYVLTESGRILRFPNKESARRMRRKLRKFKALLDAGKMSFEDLRTAYQSWRGNFKKRFNSHYCILRMDALYNELFIKRRDDAASEGNNGLYRKKKRGGNSPHKS